MTGFNFDYWKKSKCKTFLKIDTEYLKCGTQIEIDRINFFDKVIETIFYRPVPRDGYLYLGGPEEIYMEQE